MLDTLKGRAMAAVEAWRTYQAPLGPDTLDSAYQSYWALYDGSAFRQVAGRRQGVFRDQRVYRNSRLIYSHAASVGDFYAGTVFQGQLATDGKRLPDGSRGAIPIDPQTGDDATDQQLRAAVAGLWSLWNWQEGMATVPLFVSILGDGLTELIDDPRRHAVWPQFVWPGFVTDLHLDIAGNVTAYTLEYQVVQQTSRGEETFTFKKSVDKESYRYWKNEQPFDYYGEGDTVPNPYGFVPATWDRHKRTRGDRGLSAIANTRQALYELNSTFSHGMDYQRKAFAAPVLIKGSMGTSASSVVAPTRTSDPTELAETVNFREVSAEGGIEQLSFDVGKTLEMLKEVKAGILESNPEASFYHELRAMSSLTGPAVERALGDAVSRVTRARAGYDTQEVKRYQMALAMMGFRLNSGAWAAAAPMNPRDEVYRPYDLDSYKAGLMDMTILGRPVVPQTMDERLDELAKQEALQTRWALSETGLGELDEVSKRDVIKSIRDDMAATLVGDFGGDVEGQVA